MNTVETEAERALFVSEGAKVAPCERTAEAREKVSAFAVAVLLHGLLAFALGWLVIAQPRTPPPLIEARAAPVPREPLIEPERLRERTPVSSGVAGARMNVVSVSAVSELPMPRIETDLSTSR